VTYRARDADGKPVNVYFTITVEFYLSN